MESKILYLPGLNGIRAIAAIGVIYSHINNRLEYYHLENLNVLDIASYGVTMFFTLSGFLITYLLLKELDETSTINIKKFYIRRILRIWPLYFLYLGITVAVGFDELNWLFLLYIFMLPNFKNSFVHYFQLLSGGRTLNFLTGHYWSLGVEEQFYAFWVWVVKKSKNLLPILILFPIIWICFKVALRIVDAPYWILVWVNYTRFGCMVIGALGAYCLFHSQSIIKHVKRIEVQLLMVIFFILVFVNKFHITSIIDHEIVSIFTLVLIINQVDNQKKLFSLENKICDFLGKISYGLYVWNPLIIYGMSFLITDFLPSSYLGSVLIIYITVPLIIILVSYVSYTYFEKKFLKFKTRFMVVRSKSSNN
jgi:peptidoglycan/LPS O-acetylase OafA/YrhL